MGGAQSRDASNILKQVEGLGVLMQNCCPDKNFKAFGQYLCTIRANGPELDQLDLFAFAPTKQRLFAAPRGPKSPNPNANQDSLRRAWFEQFTSNGEKLTEAQVQNLFELTADWALNAEGLETRTADLKKWKDNPNSFWGTTKSNIQTIGDAIFYCEEYERTINNPAPDLRKLRRNVVKTMLYCATRCEREAQGREVYSLVSSKAKRPGGIMAVAERIRVARGAPKDQKKRVYDSVRQRARWGESLLYLGLGSILGLGGILSKYAGRARSIRFKRA
jgi:hypothetical protein